MHGQGHLLNTHNTLGDNGWKSTPLGTANPLDGTTVYLLEASALFEAIGPTRTATGANVLSRSLQQPLTDLHDIHDKQQALEELDARPDLRSRIDEFLDAYRGLEEGLNAFLTQDFAPINAYSTLRNARRVLRTLAKGPQLDADSTYLKQVNQVFDEFPQTHAYSFHKGTIYKTHQGMRSGREIGFLTPHWRTVPRHFTLPNATVLLTSYLAFFNADSQMQTNDAMVLWLLFNGMIGPSYIMAAKPLFDTAKGIRPLATELSEDESFGTALDAVGRLDELRTFQRYRDRIKERFEGDVTLPTVTDEPQYRFQAANLRNPTLAEKIGDFVPNDLALDERLTFITGPNSAGKTTICKSIAQAQMLAQAGCYVPAASCAVTIADQIAYQAPQFDSLQDEEGRFGTELRRTRDIFFRTTPRSIVILDELAEGTTIEEKMAHSRMVIDGFRAIGNATVLVTHNHALAREYEKNSTGKFLQGEFAGTEPTHRFVPGVSTNSHADVVSRRLGFTQQEIDQYLRQNGYRG